MEERVLSFIECGGDDRDFDALALDLFARQFERVALYRRFCEARDVKPGALSSWREIPALPADAFKEDLCAADLPHLFVSSGTTAGAARPSRHRLSSLATYRRSALKHFEAMVLADAPGPMAVLLMGPSAARHPNSSLGAMFGWCEQHCSNGDTLNAFDEHGGADLDAAIAWLAERAAGSAPVLLLGISSALSALFGELRSRGLELRLPADSRLVDTGGPKGAVAGVKVLSVRGLLKAAWRFLHIPAYCCVNEYGMTELLSQFYDDALLSRCDGSLTPRAKLGPPWVRTSIVDPVALCPVARGESGLLRHLDLANWESVSAIQTLDLGREVGRGFEVLGRAREAEARGCSQLLADVREQGSA